MYRIFGTYSLIAVLSPSLRNIPFTGIEWSYQMRDLGFNEKGKLMPSRRVDNEDIVFDKEEEEKKEHAIHRNTHKVADSTLDSLEEEIAI